MQVVFEGKTASMAKLTEWQLPNDFKKTGT